jgi:HD-like signal output (HDOD) protein
MLQARSGCSLIELRHLRPFRHADDRLLQALAGQVTPQWAPRGTRIIALGSDDEATYFLLEGTVRLVAGDSTEARLSANDAAAERPLSHLRPRRHDVISDTTVRYLRIDNRLLAGLAATFAEPLERAMGTDAAQPTPVAALESEFAEEIQAALDKDLLTLPSLPDIAVRVGRAVLDEKSNSRRVATVVQTDPVISAKLVRAANSAFFGGGRRVESLVAAITQLGFQLTHKLVLSFALREIFSAPSRAAQERMRELWRHSTQVSALCQTIASSDRRFDPQQALLAGLVHDIGGVAVVNHLAHRAPQLDAAIADRIVGQLRGAIGGSILRKWRFPEELVVCATEGEHWLRDPGPEPDYCDVVVVAQLLGLLGSASQLDGLPNMSEVPAFGKLRLGGGGGEDAADAGSAFLEERREQISHTERLLAS